ncbi:MAG: sulfotransferase [Caldilineae bacterium]|nr:MAG: sulfotransferase [Caldilineae bacterium]
MKLSFVRRVGRRLRDIDLVFPGWLERLLLRDVPNGSEPIRLPIVTVIGPPRVGSTLMFQVLVSQYRCFHFDNFQHSFLRYPYLAYRFSRRFITPQTGRFRSDHGYVPGLGGLSEGNFFWPYWFDMGLDEGLPRPDPRRLRHIARVMNAIWLREGLPMIGSYNSHAFYLGELARRFERVVVVNMRRDPVANAVSLLRGRLVFRGTIEQWWSNRPAECLAAGITDPYRQIVCQIAGFYRAVKEQRRYLPDAAVVDVHYEDLCRAPAEVLDRVRTACDNVGIALPQRAQPPALPRFEVRRPRPHEREHAERFRSLCAEIDWHDLWS